MSVTWNTLIERAETLAAQRSDVAELLHFYARLLAAQKSVYESIRGWRPSGRLDQDLPELRKALRPLLDTVAEYGPTLLSGEARRLSQASVTETDETLMAYWHSPTDNQFFAKAFLQPYACRLAELGCKPDRRNLESRPDRCPFCCGKPQLAVLKIDEGGGDVGSRYLLCSTCLSLWPFRRVICASCSEERPAKLGYFHTPEYDYIRVEACDSCRCYVKAIDLTRFG